MHPVLHCVAHWVHFTGTRGHPGYWRLVFFCDPVKPHLPPVLAPLARIAALLLGR